MIAILLSLVMSGIAFAQTPSSIKEISRRTATMPKQKDCKATDTCDLKSAKLIDTVSGGVASFGLSIAAVTSSTLRRTRSAIVLDCRRPEKGSGIANASFS